MHAPEVRCPKCHSAYFRRSRRRGFLETMLLTRVSVYPFRCDLCGCRFYRMAPTDRSAAIAVVHVRDAIPVQPSAN